MLGSISGRRREWKSKRRLLLELPLVVAAPELRGGVSAGLNLDSRQALHLAQHIHASSDRARREVDELQLHSFQRRQVERLMYAEEQPLQWHLSQGLERLHLASFEANE